MRKPNIILAQCPTCHGGESYWSGLHLVTCPACCGTGRVEACEQKRLQHEREITSPRCLKRMSR
jgi:DnaJ-class molecular chaperone